MNTRVRAVFVLLGQTELSRQRAGRSRRAGGGPRQAGEPAASGWTGAGVDAGGGVVDVPGRLVGGT